MPRLFLLAACMLTATTASHALNWQEVDHRPPARSGHATAYDGARRRLVLFGGSDGSRRLSDTWEWDGAHWLNVTPRVSPTPRVGHKMVYDSARGRVVLFGGDDGNWLGDTWEWDGSVWVNATSGVSPPARDHHAMAYDSARAKT